MEDKFFDLYSTYSLIILTSGLLIFLLFLTIYTLFKDLRNKSFTANVYFIFIFFNIILGFNIFSSILPELNQELNATLHSEVVTVVDYGKYEYKVKTGYNYKALIETSDNKFYLMPENFYDYIKSNGMGKYDITYKEYSNKEKVYSKYGPEKSSVYYKGAHYDIENYLYSIYKVD